MRFLLLLLLWLLNGGSSGFNWDCRLLLLDWLRLNDDHLRLDYLNGLWLDLWIILSVPILPLLLFLLLALFVLLGLLPLSCLLTGQTDKLNSESRYPDEGLPPVLDDLWIDEHIGLFPGRIKVDDVTSTLGVRTLA